MLEDAIHQRDRPDILVQVKRTTTAYDELCIEPYITERKNTRIQMNDQQKHRLSPI